MKTYLEKLKELDEVINKMDANAHFAHPTVYYVEGYNGVKYGSLSEFKIKMYRAWKKWFDTEIHEMPLNEFDGCDCYLMSKEWK